MLIFNNILRLCKENGISIAKLEKECGLGNATIRRWESSSPNVDSLSRVANFFGCTVDDLLRKDGEKEQAC